MSESLRALLAGVIDYAGTFPPAALSLEQSVDNWRAYRSSPHAWMLGRFVCPAGRLEDLASLKWSPTDGPISLIVAASETKQACYNQVIAALAAIRAYPHPAIIDTLEMALPSSLRDDPAAVMNLLGWVLDQTAARTRSVTLYCEFPSTNVSAKRSLIETIADCNRAMRPLSPQVGFKFRTGGIRAPAVPGSSDVAAVVTSCRDAGVFWKATACLHQPLRHVHASLGLPVHGFLNVLAAAVFADLRGLDEAALIAILNDDQSSHFRLDARGLAWQELTATTADMSSARQRSFQSFGSCSFEEPRQGLEEMKWL